MVSPDSSPGPFPAYPCCTLTSKSRWCATPKNWKWALQGMRLGSVNKYMYDIIIQYYYAWNSQELEEAQKSLREVEKKHQTRDRELRRSVECQQRDILTGLLEEWQRSADIAGVKKPRSLSVGTTASHGVGGGGGGGTGGNSLNSATETALVSMHFGNPSNLLAVLAPRPPLSPHSQHLLMVEKIYYQGALEWS